MAAMSIGKAWEETIAFVARESTLLLPVALLFVALPSLIVQEMIPPELTQWLASQTKPALPDIPPSFGLAMLVSVVIIWFGSLTLFALALRPGISVGEALRLGLARLPILLGTALLIVVVIVALAVLLALVIAVLAAASKGLGAMVGLVLGAALSVLALFAAVRLILLNPVVIDGTLGVTASIRHAWQLSQGYFWRLFGFLIVITMVSAIVSGAAQAVFGLIAGLIAGPTTAQFVGGLASVIVSTVLQVYMLVMIARLYRQAQPDDVADVFR